MTYQTPFLLYLNQTLLHLSNLTLNLQLFLKDDLALDALVVQCLLDVCFLPPNPLLECCQSLDFVLFQLLILLILKRDFLAKRVFLGEHIIDDSLDTIFIVAVFEIVFFKFVVLDSLP